MYRYLLCEYIYGSICIIVPFLSPHSLFLLSLRVRAYVMSRTVAWFKRPIGVVFVKNVYIGLVNVSRELVITQSNGHQYTYLIHDLCVKHI